LTLLLLVNIHRFAGIKIINVYLYLLKIGCENIIFALNKKRYSIMITRFNLFLSLIFVFFGCQEKQPEIRVQATLQEGAGSYIKFIDMTQPGLAPDSMALSIDGTFDFVQNTTEPKDFIFYFNDKEYIRLVLCPNEIVTLTANVSNLVSTYQVSGSQESVDVSLIIKRHFRAVSILDTLQQFYLKNQTNPQLTEIVEKLAFLSDSIFSDEKAFLTSFIENNPGSIAAYIALSQKLGLNKQLFTLANDLPYFVMVDTAMASRYKNTVPSKMLHTYITREKLRLSQEKENLLNDSIINQAPDVRLPNSLGDTLALSALRGKYELVDFWGSWCRPSRLNNAVLRDTYRKYRIRGFEIYQIAIEHTAANWSNTIKEDKLFWKYQVSELNYMESKAAKDFGVKTMPANFLVDPDGKIIARNLYGADLTNQLESVLKPARIVKPIINVVSDSVAIDTTQKQEPINSSSIQ